MVTLWMRMRRWMWIFLICLNTLEILRIVRKELLFRNQVGAHCLTQPNPSSASIRCVCFVRRLLPTFEFLCVGLLKRHSDKCGSMNRFSFTHTMHKTVHQLNRKIGIHKSDACMCKSIMVCVRMRVLQIGLNSSVQFSKKCRYCDIIGWI